jgi:hypothetical protein
VLHLVAEAEARRWAAAAAFVRRVGVAVRARGVFTVALSGRIVQQLPGHAHTAGAEQRCLRDLSRQWREEGRKAAGGS